MENRRPGAQKTKFAGDDAIFRVNLYLFACQLAAISVRSARGRNRLGQRKTELRERRLPVTWWHSRARRNLSGIKTNSLRVLLLAKHAEVALLFMDTVAFSSRLLRRFARRMCANPILNQEDGHAKIDSLAAPIAFGAEIKKQRSLRSSTLKFNGKN